MQQEGIKQRRVAALDALRGFAMLNAVLFHALYDWVDVFGRTLAGLDPRTGAGYLWQQSICWTFILLAGFVYSFSRNPVRHGMLLLGCGLMLTAITALVMPSQLIVFGILHFLGVAALLTTLARPVLERLNPAVGCVLSFLLFWTMKCVPSGALGFGDWALVQLPGALYRSAVGFLWGMPRVGFYSSDYFPVIPWLFLFWTGLFFWRWRGPQVMERLARVPTIPFLNWVGRHSLLIYLLHQPVLMALFIAAQQLG